LEEKIMYLVLSRNPDNLLEKLNQVITDLGKPHLAIKTLHESPTQSEPFKIVPIWKKALVYTPSDEFEQIEKRKEGTTTSLDLLTHRVKMFEAFINPDLYKKQIQKPQLSVLSATGEDIEYTLALAFSKIPVSSIITILIGAFFSINALSAITIHPILATITLILIALAGRALDKRFVAKKQASIVRKIETVGIHNSLFRQHPEDLVESVRILMLLEDEANESVFKNIIKMAITAPKKAIQATAVLVKKSIPEGSEARRNYLAMLKDAYDQVY
jgi:hypothetical protein